MKTLTKKKSQPAQTPKKVANLTIKTAERVVTMSTGEPWRLRFDHASTYELEEETGESLPNFLEQMHLELTVMNSTKKLYDFAWFLSASHRALQDIEITPPKFRAILPQGELKCVADMVASILAEVFPSDPDKSAIRPVGESGNGSLVPAVSTGPNASTSP